LTDFEVCALFAKRQILPPLKICLLAEGFFRVKARQTAVQVFLPSTGGAAEPV